MCPFPRSIRRRSAHERAGDVHSGRASECGVPLASACMVSTGWVVRTAGPVEGLTAEIQRALARVDPNLPVSGFYSMKDLLARTLATQRIEVALLGAMAALALLLSAVGIFARWPTGRAEDARDRHPHALGSTVGQAMVQMAARVRAPHYWAWFWARPFCRCASSHAQCALWRRRLRCANPGHRGAHPCIGDAAGHNPADPESCEDRPSQYVARE